MKKFKIIYLLLIVVITGCATGTADKYAEYLRDSHGKTELDLVRASGSPQKEYTSQSGNKFLTYIHRDYDLLLSTYIYCETTFEIEKGIIISTSFVGKACTAK